MSRYFDLEPYESDTLDSLTAEANAWFDANGFQPMCMWDFSAELGARLEGHTSVFIAAETPVTPAHYDFAIKFCERWWAAEDRHDERAAA